MDGLSVLLACGQLLGLPMVIYLMARGRYTQVPLAMVVLVVVHFAPYSWLYDTPVYLVMGAVASIAAVLADATAHRNPTRHGADAVGAARTCLATGVVMLGGAGAALLL